MKPGDLTIFNPFLGGGANNRTSNGTQQPFVDGAFGGRNANDADDLAAGYEEDYQEIVDDLEENGASGTYEDVSVEEDEGLLASENEERNGTFSATATPFSTTTTHRPTTMSTTRPSTTRASYVPEREGVFEPRDTGAKRKVFKTKAEHDARAQGRRPYRHGGEWGSPNPHAYIPHPSSKPKHYASADAIPQQETSFVAQPPFPWPWPGLHPVPPPPTTAPPTRKPPAREPPPEEPPRRSQSAEDNYGIDRDPRMEERRTQSNPNAWWRNTLDVMKKCWREITLVILVIMVFGIAVYILVVSLLTAMNPPPKCV